VTTLTTFNVLKELFQDFPSTDPLVRHVLLLQVFVCETAASNIMLSESFFRIFVERCQQKIESIGLPPVERHDLLEVLSSKFAPERFQGIIMYGRLSLGMSNRAIDDLVREVAFRCLEIGCKGKMLKKLVELYPPVEDAIRRRVMQKYRLMVEDLPPWEDEEACLLYEAPLCQDFLSPRTPIIERVQSPTDARASDASAETVALVDAMQVDIESMAMIPADGEVAALSEDSAAKVTGEDVSDDEDEDDLVSTSRYLN
jgi:hypothetical protein